MKCWVLLDLFGFQCRKWDAFCGDFLLVEQVEIDFSCVSAAAAEVTCKDPNQLPWF